MHADGGDAPLVVGPFALCSTEMVSLLLHGIARGNICAYNLDGTKATWRRPLQAHDGPQETPDDLGDTDYGTIGMLSMAEVDGGRPLADELKSPTQPVFVVHGGDHFTVCFHAGVNQVVRVNHPTRYPNPTHILCGVVSGRDDPIAPWVLSRVCFSREV